MSLRFAAGDVSQAFYWIGALGFYIALLFLAIHIWNDSNIVKDYPKLRRVIVFVVIGCIGMLWTRNIFGEAPLQLTGYGTMGDYGDNPQYAPFHPWDSQKYEDGR